MLPMGMYFVTFPLLSIRIFSVVENIYFVFLLIICDFFRLCSIWWFEWISICTGDDIDAADAVDSVAIFVVVYVEYLLNCICIWGIMIHCFASELVLNVSVSTIFGYIVVVVLVFGRCCLRWVIHWLVKSKKKMPMRFLLVFVISNVSFSYYFFCECYCLVHNKQKLYNNQNLCIKTLLFFSSCCSCCYSKHSIIQIIVIWLSSSSGYIFKKKKESFMYGFSWLVNNINSILFFWALAEL